MYESLTKFIPAFDNEEKNDAVSYPGIYDFLEAIYKFTKKHPEFRFEKYQEILKKNNLEWRFGSLSEEDESALDGELEGQIIVLIIFRAVRSDRFCEGALAESFKNGRIQKCLMKLKAIDENN